MEIRWNRTHACIVVNQRVGGDYESLAESDLEPDADFRGKPVRCGVPGAGAGIGWTCQDAAAIQPFADEPPVDRNELLLRTDESRSFDFLVTNGRWIFCLPQSNRSVEAGRERRIRPARSARCGRGRPRGSGEPPTERVVPELDGRAHRHGAESIAFMRVYSRPGTRQPVYCLLDDRPFGGVADADRALPPAPKATQGASPTLVSMSWRRQKSMLSAAPPGFGTVTPAVLASAPGRNRGSP